MSLKLTSLYLAGPIDRCPDMGKNWRKNITPFLESLGIIVLDPTNKPKGCIQEDENTRMDIERLKKEKRLKEIKDKYAHQIRNLDLHLVDRSNAVIAYITTKIFMTGTFEEIFLANNLRKPVLLYCAEGIANVPSWLCLTFPAQHFFEDWYDLKDYIQKVNDGYDDSDLTNRIWYTLDNVAMVERALSQAAERS